MTPREGSASTVEESGGVPSTPAATLPAMTPRPRPEEDGVLHRLTTSIGSELSAPRSISEAATPASTSREPSAATIAPLSVHSRGLGTRSTMPAAAHRSSASARSREFAATPPPALRG